MPKTFFTTLSRWISKIRDLGVWFLFFLIIYVIILVKAVTLEGLVHNPLFGIKTARRMFSHTFRGTTLRTLLGLEGEREAFHRYRRIRSSERQYL